MKNNRAEDFRNFEIEPSMKVWKGIESKLPQKKKRRRFFLWVATALVISGITWQLLMKDKSMSDNVSNNGNKSLVEKPKINSTSDVTASITSDKKQNQNSNIINPAKNSLDKEKIESKISNLSIQKNGANNKSQPATYTASLNNNATLTEEIYDRYQVSTLSLIYNDFDFEFSTDVVERKSLEQKNKKLTRWSLYVDAGWMKTVSTEIDDADQESGNKKMNSIDNNYFGAGVRYDLHPRIKFSFGLALTGTGLEQEGNTTIYLHGLPGDTNSTYSFQTSIGELSGVGTDFNSAFYESPDSVLFPWLNTMTASQPVTAIRMLKVRQEFQYLEIPLMVIFKPAERKVNPFAGIFFSTGFLLDQKIFVNDRRLYFDFNQKISTVIFSGGITAGCEFNFSRRTGVFLNAFYKHGLNPVVKSESNWKSNQAGVGAGINYRIGRNR